MIYLFQIHSFCSLEIQIQTNGTFEFNKET
jgi:hypothetical protein